MKIKLNEMVFYGYHGVHEEERSLGQRFIVSLVLETDPVLDDRIRNLEHTVDYTKVYSEVKEIMESHQFHLLETCANTIATKLLADFCLLQKITICIQKPSVPINGSLKSVEVELSLSRN
jgi:dihydroneopterin aldolase